MIPAKGTGAAAHGQKLVTSFGATEQKLETGPCKIMVQGHQQNYQTRASEGSSNRTGGLSHRCQNGGFGLGLS